MTNRDRLRSAIDRLARIDRASCSKGEAEAAAWIATELQELGATARVEPERVHGTYWWPLGITSTAGLIGGVAAGRGRRRVGTALAALAAAAAADDLMLGPRLLRRLLPKQIASNVLAQAGDAEGEITILLVAHHDAAHTGMFFNPKLTAWLDRFQPEPGEAPRHPPIMAPIVIAPALVAMGALTGLRRLRGLGAAICAVIAASVAEVALRPTVPGANDNLSGVATLLGIAQALGERPVRGVRVLLVSTGAEEALMEGMRAFSERHFEQLEADRAYVLCVDSVGSPFLVLAAAEGMLRLRHHDVAFNDLIADCARAHGIALRRGFEMRLGTDGYLALRHGLRAALLTSVDEYGAASNYHWPTDTPDRVDYARLSDTVELCEAVIRRLADRTAPEASLATTATRETPRAARQQPALP